MARSRIRSRSRKIKRRSRVRSRRRVRRSRTRRTGSRGNKRRITKSIRTRTKRRTKRRIAQKGVVHAHGVVRGGSRPLDGSPPLGPIEGALHRRADKASENLTYWEEYGIRGAAEESRRDAARTLGLLDGIKAADKEALRMGRPDSDDPRDKEPWVKWAVFVALKFVYWHLYSEGAINEDAAPVGGEDEFLRNPSPHDINTLRLVWDERRKMRAERERERDRRGEEEEKDKEKSRSRRSFFGSAGRQRRREEEAEAARRREEEKEKSRRGRSVFGSAGSQKRREEEAEAARRREEEATATALTKEGDAHLEKGDYAFAVEAFKEALDLDPSNTELQKKIVYGEEGAEAGRAHEALAAVAAQDEVNPLPAVTRHRRGAHPRVAARPKAGAN